MIEVRHDPYRVVRPQRFQELGADALRQDDRNARREPDRLDARDPAELSDELDDPIGGHDERITAAQDDVANLRVVPEIRKRLGELFERACAAAGADEAASRAKAT